MPFRYQEMPPEFNGLPICDLDVYYEDRKTFMVISGGKVCNEICSAGLYSDMFRLVQLDFTQEKKYFICCLRDLFLI